MSNHKVEPTSNDLIAEIKSLPPFSSNVMSLEMALDWAQLIIQSSDSDTELIFLKVFKDQQLIGIAQVMLVKKLETYDYLWQPVASLIEKISPLRAVFPKLNIAFLEVPIANYAGLFTIEKIDDEQKKQIYQDLSNYIRQHLKAHVLCIKEHHPEFTFNDDKRFAPLAFLPNTELTLEQASFDGFVKAMPSKKRRKLKVDQKALAQAGARIEFCDDPSSLNDKLYHFYKKTAEKKTQESNHLRVPVSITKAFFDKFSDYKHLKPAAILVKIEDRLIAYCLLMQSEDTVFFKSVGLDYQDSYTSKAYFNMIYATIDYALQRGCKKVDFGVTSYTFKKRIGCQLIPANYFVSFYHPLLHIFRKLALYLLGLRFGSVED